MHHTNRLKTWVDYAQLHLIFHSLKLVLETDMTMIHDWGRWESKNHLDFCSLYTFIQQARVLKIREINYLLILDKINLP